MPFFGRFFRARARSDATSARLQRDFGGSIFSADPPQGGAFSRAQGYYNDPGTQTRDPTRPGPEARRILLTFDFNLHLRVCVNINNVKDFFAL